MENEKDLNVIPAEELQTMVESISFFDNIATENVKQFFQKIAIIVLGKPINTENIDLEKFREIVAELLCTLSPRERDVLRIRLGMDDSRMRTLEEVGQLFGVKKDEIQLIEAKALRKLRHPNLSKYLRQLIEAEIGKSIDDLL